MPGSNGSGYVVLVADDDRDILALVAFRLGRDGHLVLTAGDGEEALGMARERPPDLVILDVRMPIINGIQFLRQIRTQPEFDDVAVAIVTGDYFLSEDIQDELRRLRASVRFKPIWLEDVVALARTLTRR